MEHGEKDRDQTSALRGQTTEDRVQRDFQSFNFKHKSGTLITNIVFYPDPWPLNPDPYISFERVRRRRTIERFERFERF